MGLILKQAYIVDYFKHFIFPILLLLYETKTTNEATKYLPHGCTDGEPDNAM